MIVVASAEINVCIMPMTHSCTAFVAIPVLYIGCLVAEVELRKELGAKFGEREETGISRSGGPSVSGVGHIYVVQLSSNLSACHSASPEVEKRREERSRRSVGASKDGNV